MDKSIIDNIVWYIPFKKLRNSIRELLLYFYNKSESDNYPNYKYITFERDKNFENKLNTIIHLSKFINYKRTYNGDGLELIPKYNYNMLYYSDFGNIENKIQELYDINKIYQTFNLFSDEYSKDIYLMQIINYSFFEEIGKGVMWPLYYSHIWKYYTEFENTIIDNININNKDYYVFDLSLINIPLKLYYPNKNEIFSDFILEQYRYKNKVIVTKGDYVIDAGAFMGDTALYFANLVGKQGRVYSFEFIDDNLDMFYKNIELNKSLKDIIHIIKNPLYSKSNEELIINMNGPASRIDKSNSDNDASKFISMSIDDFVFNNKIEKIDFIKMDIEGAELDALKGAEKTILQFRPKLAISVYHNFSDYYEIPLLLSKMLNNYEFYFDHFKVGRGESVLFCKPI